MNVKKYNGLIETLNNYVREKNNPKRGFQKMYQSFIGLQYEIEIPEYNEFMDGLDIIVINSSTKKQRSYEGNLLVASIAPCENNGVRIGGFFPDQKKEVTKIIHKFYLKFTDQNFNPENLVSI